MGHPSRKGWQAIRMRRGLAAPDPDLPPRAVELPAHWDQSAAEALAALAPAGKVASLREAAEMWLSRLPAPLADATLRGLLTRRAAPDEAIWTGRDDSYALNLAAFDEPGLGLDVPALRATAIHAVEALRVLAPTVAPVLRLTDLDGLLAASGLDYASEAGRDTAVSVAGLIRDAVGGVRLVGAPGVVDGLLGAEAGGVAPRFDWLDGSGRLSRAAVAFLAARGTSAEAALAAALGGCSPLTVAGTAAHAAMRAALTPVLILPETGRPAAASAPRREPPARTGGYARRITLGGHKLFVRTGEFADGTLAELSLGLPKESASVRALADSLGQLASLALQHGTPLADIVDLLAGTRFGPAGAVEGDPDIARASSPIDYLARSLAAAYLPDLTLEAADEEAVAPPALPLDLPPQARPRLRVVR